MSKRELDRKMLVSPPRFEIVKSPDYRTLYVTGFLGGLDPTEARVILFQDRLEPRIKGGGQPGEMELEKVNRELLVELRMMATTFVGLAKWAQDHIRQIEQQFGSIVKEEEAQEKEESANMVT